MNAVNAVDVLTVHHEEEPRRAIRAVVAGTPGFRAVGEVASAEEALELALEVRPALALVAAELPGIDGHETRERLTAAVPGTAVVLIDAAEPAHLTGASLRALWERAREG